MKKYKGKRSPNKLKLIKELIFTLDASKGYLCDNVNISDEKIRKKSPRDLLNFIAQLESHKQNGAFTNQELTQIYNRCMSIKQQLEATEDGVGGGSRPVFNLKKTKSYIASIGNNLSTLLDKGFIPKKSEKKFASKNLTDKTITLLVGVASCGEFKETYLPILEALYQNDDTNDVKVDSLRRSYEEVYDDIKGIVTKWRNSDLLCSKVEPVITLLKNYKGADSANKGKIVCKLCEALEMSKNFYENLLKDSEKVTNMRDLICYCKVLGSHDPNTPTCPKEITEVYNIWQQKIAQLSAEERKAAAQKARLLYRSEPKQKRSIPRNRGNATPITKKQLQAIAHSASGTMPTKTQGPDSYQANLSTTPVGVYDYQKIKEFIGSIS